MNTQTFTQYVLPFKDKMYRLAKRLLVSKEEAEDALQETYLKLWNNQHQLSQYKNLEAYALTMTKNFCLDRLKSKQAQRISLEPDYFTKTTSETEHSIENHESIALIEKYINQLPETQKIIIQLRDVEGYEFEEIENIVQMNPTAIRVNLSRARKKIKEQLLLHHQFDTTAQYTTK